VTSDGVSPSSRVEWMPTEATSPVSRSTSTPTSAVYSYLGLHVIKVSPKPVPNIWRSSPRPMRTLQTPRFKPFPAPQAIRADGTALLSREVVYGFWWGNKKPPICGRFF
jgi:hypothetical protein